ncbi:hypothetical protein [Lentibacillus jeotgali]|nr:hypothetical protein [Lentibacillus jeotgali]
MSAVSEMLKVPDVLDNMNKRLDNLQRGQGYIKLDLKKLNDKADYLSREI